MVISLGEEPTMIRFAAKIMLTGLTLSVLIGCMGPKSMWMYPYAESETLVQTPDEHRQQVLTSVEQDRRALNEDLDLLFMTDRPTRLTRWHGR